MRWKQKRKKIKSKPKSKPPQGAEKWKVRFAVFPKKIIDDEWLWLERYKTLYRWTTRSYETPLRGYNVGIERRRVVTGWHIIRREPLKLNK